MRAKSRHRRAKERRARDLKRRAAQRASYDMVLIVCEGEKTEPQYFRELRQAHRLKTANVEIMPSDYGSDPESVVKFAIEKFKERREADRVYCVFDRDQHANFDQAVQRVADTKLSKRSGGRIQFSAITSTPCFELWLLLHFEYTSRPYSATGQDSPCDNIIADLAGYLPAYRKGAPGVYRTMEPNVDLAIVHARNLRSENKKTGSINPATDLDILVSYLRVLGGI